MNTKVKLTKRYEVPGCAPFDTIELRQPTYAELFMSGIGRPFEFHPTNSGVMVTRSPEVVDRYAQILIVSPGYEFISGISAVDGLRVENAINGFFMESRAPSPSPDPLSSDTVFDPAMSSE